MAQLERPCAFASPERTFADRCPVPERSWDAERRHATLPGGQPGARRSGARHCRQRRQLAGGDRADRQHATRPRGRRRRRRRGVAQHERLRRGVGEPARGRPRADHRRRLQAVPGRRGKLHPRAAGRQRPLAVRCRGTGARRVDACRCGDGMPPATRPRRRRPCRWRCGTTPRPPQLGFESPVAADPTLVAVAVTDRVSGLARGSIEISRERLGRLAGAADPDVGKPTGRTHRRRRASRGRLRGASARRRPGGQRGVDGSPA